MLTTAVVEHPETVAKRLTTYARLGPSGSWPAPTAASQGALFQRQHPSDMWAKFEALVEGAWLASAQLWR